MKKAEKQKANEAEKDSRRPADKEPETSKSQKEKSIGKGGPKPETPGAG